MAKTPSKSTNSKTTGAKPKSKATSLRSKTKAVSTRPTAARKAAIKPVAKPALKPVVTPIKPDAAARTELSKKELVERIATESGSKKSEVRTILDATLRVVSDTLNKGHDIAAAPLGKIKVARQKDTPNGKLVVCRIKLKDPASTPAKGPLVKPAE